MSDSNRCMMTAGELAKLRALAENRLVLEMGCYVGETTARLAAVAREVWTIDHHKGDEFVGKGWTLHDYVETLSIAGVLDKVTTIVGSFDKVCRMLMPTRWDLIIVDGSHHERDVYADCLHAWGLAGMQGTIAVHDWGRWGVSAGAVRALNQPHTIVESLAIWEYGGSRWGR